MPDDVIIHVDGKDLIGREAFHETFVRLLGFDDRYGRDTAAWLNYMDRLRRSTGALHASLGDEQLLVLRIADWHIFQEEGWAEFDLLIECAAVVNQRSVERGERPLLVLTTVDEDEAGKA